jgi:hypothetical protein
VLGEQSKALSSPAFPFTKKKHNMTVNSEEGFVLEAAAQGVIVEKAIADGFQLGNAPLKVVTGTQTTSALSFELKPGAIVAHAGSKVIFVCG